MNIKDKLTSLEKSLAKDLSDLLNQRGPHRTREENQILQESANKIADILGDLRHFIETKYSN